VGRTESKKKRKEERGKRGQGSGKRAQRKEHRVGDEGEKVSRYEIFGQRINSG
jgi:hypothetical protein